MVEIWFALLCFTIVVFVVLDGWDIGAGALHLIAAKSQAERREVVAAIGPLWGWNEVWLPAAGVRPHESIRIMGSDPERE